MKLYSLDKKNNISREHKFIKLEKNIWTLKDYFVSV